MLKLQRYPVSVRSGLSKAINQTITSTPQHHQSCAGRAASSHTLACLHAASAGEAAGPALSLSPRAVCLDCPHGFVHGMPHTSTCHPVCLLHRGGQSVLTPVSSHLQLDVALNQNSWKICAQPSTLRSYTNRQRTARNAYIASVNFADIADARPACTEQPCCDAAVARCTRRVWRAQLYSLASCMAHTCTASWQLP